ncbi:MAG: OsmC family protein [Anaerolineae bacterium]|nr:OsmC family protein [Anaerolineae bacterium]
MNEYTITARWVRNLQFVGTDGGGHSVVMDSPLGENTGMRPAELLMVALAGCTAMDVISILQKKQQKVVDFEVKITGQRRPDHPRAWTHMHIEYIVRGKGVERAAVERAVELSTTKYCSVHATLEGKVEMTHSIIIEEAEAR